MVLKELILTVSTLGECSNLERKNRFLTVSTFRRYGGLERTGYLTVSTLGVCGGLERTDFNSL